MYDVLIIGGGPAGLTAAIYCGRGGMKTAVLESIMTGGQMNRSHKIENYAGFTDGIPGHELGAKMLAQATKFGAEIISEKATAMDVEGSTKKVWTNSGQYEAQALIICTGAKPRALGLQKEAKLTGAGVSYCATCDGAFFRGMEVAVVGGGDTALDDTIFLSKYVKKVYLIHRRDQFRGSQITQTALRKLPNCELIMDSVVEKLNGETEVQGIEVKNLKTSQTRQIAVSGLFIAVGQAPDTEWFKDKISLTPEGFIIANENMHTSREGVFAAGDARVKLLRQVTTAAADGATAAYSAMKYISERA
jgi:thioredoxin reductase (NADPH)